MRVNGATCHTAEGSGSVAMRLRVLFRRYRRSMVAVASLALVTLPASDAAMAQAGSATCQSLERQLAAAPAGGGGQFTEAARRQRAEIGTLSRSMRELGCTANGGGGGQCAALGAQLGRMQANLRRLEASAASEGGGQRARIMAAIAANRCREAAPTRQAVVPPRPTQTWSAVNDESPEREIFRRQVRTPEVEARPQGAYREAAPAARQPNFLERLFGMAPARRADTEPVAVEPPLPLDPQQPRIIVDGENQRPRNVGHRTVCVRLCDGAFFPLTSSPRPGADVSQGEMCRLQCPGAETEVFRMTDADIENAVSVSSGRRYMSVSNALRFRREFVQGCACRPLGQNWAEAVSRSTDPTLRAGDVVVTPEQARLMSLPTQHREQARNEQRAVERARREAERQARADRRGETPNSTIISLDGSPQPAPLPDAPALRTTGAGAVAQEPPPFGEARPVRVIGPLPAPRADAPAPPRG